MTIKWLRILLLSFFCALAIPSSVLVYQSYGQLKWETFHQHQQLAREISLRIDARFDQLLQREVKRPFSDYVFLTPGGEQKRSFRQPSPLSEFPLDSDIPGLLGYFQVDAIGRLITPIVPSVNDPEFGISTIELEQRVAAQNRILNILDQNSLIRKTASVPAVLSAAETPPEPKVSADLKSQLEPSESKTSSFGRTRSDNTSAIAEEAEYISSGQSMFDSLKRNRAAENIESDNSVLSERVADLKLNDRYQVSSSKNVAKPAAISSKARVNSFETQAPAARKKVKKEPAVTGLEKPATSPDLGLDQQKLGIVVEEMVVDELVLSNMAAAEKEAPGASKNDEDQASVLIRAFESEIGSFEFSLLDSGHLVLFRWAWQDNQRFVQGLLFEPEALFDQFAEAEFRKSNLSSMSNLIVSYQGRIMKTFDIQDYLVNPVHAEDDLLYQTRLVAPFSDIELIYSIGHLPLGAGGEILIWSALVLGLVLTLGFVVLYWLALKQIMLTQQQQDFVAAVSHELKTPLTSIRMYGEILREGWAEESRKAVYYDYIYTESERLSRLINNVLHLARMKRSEQNPVLELITVTKLIDENLTGLKSQTEQAGFGLETLCAGLARSVSVNVDRDWFAQILINLIDNAIKFSVDAVEKKVCINCHLVDAHHVSISIRDFGPGIDKKQAKKIFKLFYRSENELTRETTGTGIGLALVQRLVKDMGGEINLVNRKPGAEFRLVFPVNNTV